MTKPIPSRSIRKAVRSVPDAYVACRALSQHSWTYTTVEREDSRTLIQGLHCNRCDTNKHQYIDSRSGEILKSKYSYAEDYVIPALGFLTKAERGSLRLRAMGCS